MLNKDTFKEKLKKIFKNLPEIEVNRAIISVDGKVYTWKECMGIIEKDESSDLTKKIIDRLEEIIK